MRIVGTDGDDRLSGTEADDVLEGLGGDDLLEARDGTDTLLGGAGDDRLRLNYGDGAVMDGGAGNDTLGSYAEDGGGAVTMTGGAGADVFLLADGVTVTDYAAEDALFVEIGFVPIYVIDDQVTRTDLGDATVRFDIDPLAFRYVPWDMLDQGLSFTVTGDTDGLMMVPGAPVDLGETFMSTSRTGFVVPPVDGFTSTDDGSVVTALAPAEGARLVGASGYAEDVLTGQGGDDTLDGGLGGDVLSGGGGADLVLGGADDDLLGGGAGDDTVEGGGGADLIYGSAGADLLTGGGGDDLVFGGAGADVIYGDGGAG